MEITCRRMRQERGALNSLGGTPFLFRVPGCRNPEGNEGVEGMIRLGIPFGRPPVGAVSVSLGAAKR